MDRSKDLCEALISLVVGVNYKSRSTPAARALTARLLGERGSPVPEQYTTNDVGQYELDL